MAKTKYKRIVDARLSEKEKHRRAFKLMTTLFIGTSLLIFGTMLIIWVASALPNVQIPFSFQVNTLVIIISSGLLHMGLRSLKHDKIHEAGLWVKGAMLTGLVFAVVQINGWGGFLASNTAYRNILFPVTVVHVLHIVVGIGLLIFAVRKITDYQNHSRNLDFTINVSRFWHFLTYLWVGFMLVL